MVDWNDVTADSDTGVASGLGYLDVNRRMYWCPMCPKGSQQRHTRYLEAHMRCHRLSAAEVENILLTLDSHSVTLEG